MNDARDVISAALVVLAAILACKGKTGGSGAGSAAPAAAGPASTCTPSTKEVRGSLHAEVAFETAMDPPLSKRKESYRCGERDAVALRMEYSTPAAARSACNLVGPQLWGGSAPTREHPDEVMTKDGSLVIVSGKAIDDLAAKLAAEGHARWRPGAASGGGTASALDDLKATLDCGAASQDPLRAWCVAVAEPTSGFNFPATPTTYVGITAAVKAGTPVRSALLGAVTVSALSVGAGRIKVTSITPDNEGEKKTLLKTAALISNVLKSASTSNVEVGAALAGFLDGLKKDLATAGKPVAATSGKPASYAGANPSEVALVQGKVDAYVVLEHANDGTWLNVFPIRSYAP
jgi:hypothetical protein